MKRYLWTILSALLVVFSFAPWNFHYLIWIALIPWLFVLSRSPSLKEAFRHGILFSFVMTLGGFYWIAYAIYNFGGVPYPLAWLLCLIFCIIGQPQFWAVSPLYAWVLKRRQKLNAPLLTLLITGSYVLIDYISPRLFLDGLGYSLVSNLPVLQWAEWGGLSLLTLGIVAVNAVGFLALDFIRRGLQKEAGYSFMVWVLALAALHGIGSLRLKSVEEALWHPATESMHVSVIQANIGDSQKIASERGSFEAGDFVNRTYLEMTEKAVVAHPETEAILWPETAYPTIWRKSENQIDQFRETKILSLIKRLKIPLLFGGYDYDGKKDYNSLFMLSPQGDSQVYHKTVLLPFAEYVPGFENWKWFRDQFPQMGFFGAGPGPLVYDVQTPKRSFKAGPLICYEGLLPYFTRSLRKQGSQVLVNVTNDSWFGPNGEPYLHLALTSLRSVETRLPLIRATNTGITTLILPTGELVAPTALGEALIAPYRIPLAQFNETWYVKYGDSWLWFVALLTLLGWARVYRPKFR